VSKVDGLYDLLFELSNKNRHLILLLLRTKKMRITDIAREMDLNNPEIRRHVSRLQEINLIERDVEGYYSLTPFGKASLIFFQEVEFLSKNSEYFKSHRIMQLPLPFLKQIGKLNDTNVISNPLDFIRHTQNLLKESEKQVCLLVEQFPMNLLPNVVEAIDRGVEIKIIESKEQVLDPDLSKLTSEESKALYKTRSTPLYERRRIEEISLQFFLSESNCIICFPVKDDHYDYTGFQCSDDASLEWCTDLFDYYWDQATLRVQRKIEPLIKRGYSVSVKEQVTVTGLNDPELDAQAVQDAVDNYKSVILRGKFNFGNSSISLSNSVVIRGEEREGEIPLTSIYKNGWSFPFQQFTSIFEVDEDDLDVTIENLSFTDFNCSCILQRVNTINSMKILNNRITVPTGYGRGITYGSFGEWLQGILIQNVGKGGVLVKGNYIDLASWGMWRGSLNRGGLEENPEYRPNLINHEYFVGFGIAVNDCSGKVEIKNNVVKNVNGRGIALSQHYETAEVFIQDNLVESDVYGSYPFSSRESSAGILAQTGYGDKNLPSYYICIENNTIRLNKINSSGIVALGPVSEGSEKLHGGLIRNNFIYLKNGYEGIHLRKCDEFRVLGNMISGNAYYGIRISGHRKFGDLDMSSTKNQVKDNNLDKLKIKETDDYVSNHSDGKMFASSLSDLQTQTMHIWLDQYTRNNEIYMRENEILLDEGENNIIREPQIL
jgi:parallel beta-helix repeat protein